MDIKFYSTKDEYGCFSNFSAHPIWIGSHKWPTSEHYFQAQKFTNGQDVEDIRLEISPMKAAQIGRDRNRPIFSDWDDRKITVMRRALWAKVLQHDDVYDCLLNTGNARIIEHTKNDNYWADGGDGTGKNMLGILLMEIRTKIQDVELQFVRGDFNTEEKQIVRFPLEVSHPGVEGMFWNMGIGEERATMLSRFQISLSPSGQKKYPEVMEEFEATQDWLIN